MYIYYIGRLIDLQCTPSQLENQSPEGGGLVCFTQLCPSQAWTVPGTKYMLNTYLWASGIKKLVSYATCTCAFPRGGEVGVGGTSPMGSGAQSLRTTMKSVMADMWSSKAGGVSQDRAPGRLWKGNLGSRWRLGLGDQSTGGLCRRMYGRACHGRNPGPLPAPFPSLGTVVDPPLPLPDSLRGQGQARRQKQTERFQRQPETLFIHQNSTPGAPALRQKPNNLKSDWGSSFSSLLK